MKKQKQKKKVKAMKKKKIKKLIIKKTSIKKITPLISKIISIPIIKETPESGKNNKNRNKRRNKRKNARKTSASGKRREKNLWRASPLQLRHRQ